MTLRLTIFPQAINQDGVATAVRDVGQCSEPVGECPEHIPPWSPPSGATHMLFFPFQRPDTHTEIFPCVGECPSMCQLHARAVLELRDREIGPVKPGGRMGPLAVRHRELRFCGPVSAKLQVIPSHCKCCKPSDDRCRRPQASSCTSPQLRGDGSHESASRSMVRRCSRRSGALSSPLSREATPRRHLRRGAASRPRGGS